MRIKIPLIVLSKLISFQLLIFFIINTILLSINNKILFACLHVDYRFLSNCLFATCSDDSTVALWDKRNLKTKVRSLHGHMNWVKNIEYSTKEKLLVTSGFDGGIFTWDINSSTEQGFVYQKVFHTPGLMRCRLSPDSNQLVCTHFVESKYIYTYI